MYERFTDRARKVMNLAEEEARRLGHTVVGATHMLLGIIKERHGYAGNVLRSLGATLEDLRDKVEKVIPTSWQGDVAGPIPLASDAELVITYAWEEAELLGHTYVGTEDLLLGLIRGNHGASYVLRESDLSEERIRQQVKIALGQDEDSASDDECD